MIQQGLFIEQGTGIINAVMASPAAIDTVITARKKTGRDQRRDESQHTCIPVFAIYPNRIVGYNEIERAWTRNLSGIQGFDEFGFEKPLNEAAGVISKAANKRILNAVNWLYFLSKKKTTTKKNITYQFRVNFITLTLPSAQKHTDKYIKKEMLNDFLEWMRYNGVKSYIWKAEPQKNGNIHFHITSNVFLEWKLIRDKWNSICKKHGYLDPYHDKFKNCSLPEYLNIRMAEGVTLNHEAATKAWETGNKDNWLNPNSTDVHSTRKVKKMAAYMAKYMTKTTEMYLVKWVKDTAEADRDVFLKDRDKTKDLYNEATGLTRVFVKRMILGRIWYLSTNLSKVKAPVIVAAGSDKLANDFNILKSLKSSFFKAYDFATVMYYDYRDAIKAKCTSFIDELMQKVFDLSPVIN